MPPDPRQLTFEALVICAAYFWGLQNAPGLAVGLTCVLLAAARFYQ